MQNPKALPRTLTFDCYPGGELRRRVADCRERLRRNRAARRIAERASPRVEELAAEAGQVLAPAAHFGVRGKED